MSVPSASDWLLELCDPEGCCRIPAGRLTTACVAALVETARDHGVAGTVIRNLRMLLRQETLPAAMVDHQERSAILATLQEQHQRCIPETAQSLLLRGTASSLLASMRREGFQAAIVKGEDFADRLYELPALRPFRDIDLLMPRNQIDRVDDLMQSRGFRFVTPPGKYNPEYGERTWDKTGPPRIRVELHWNMINCPSQRSRSSLAWEDLDWSETEGQWRASAESLLLIACSHATISHRFDRLQHLCDIRQLGRGHAGTIDVARMRDMIRRCGLAAAVTGSLMVTAKLLQETTCSELLAALRLPALQTPWKLLVSSQTLLSPERHSSKLRRTMIREWMKRAA